MRLDLDRMPIGQSDLPVDGRLLVTDGDEGPGEARILGNLRIDNLESRFVVRGKLTATIKVDCGRCLSEFELTYPVPVELVILRDSGSERDDSDTLVVHQRDGVVDLDEVLREATVLALPLTRICRDECRGICVQCGTDLNTGSCDCVDDEVDPRWDGLPG